MRSLALHCHRVFVPGYGTFSAPVPEDVLGPRARPPREGVALKMERDRAFGEPVETALY